MSRVSLAFGENRGVDIRIASIIAALRLSSLTQPARRGNRVVEEEQLVGACRGSSSVERGGRSAAAQSSKLKAAKQLLLSSVK